MPVGYLYESGWMLFDRAGTTVDTKANDEALEPTLQFMNLRVSCQAIRSEPNVLSCTNSSGKQLFSEGNSMNINSSFLDIVIKFS
jgi:hypothetical protein